MTWWIIQLRRGTRTSQWHLHWELGLQDRFICRYPITRWTKLKIWHKSTYEKEMTYQIYKYSYLSESALWLRLFSCRIFSLVFSPPFQSWGGLPFYLLDTSHWCKHILTAPTFRRFSGGNISTRKTWRWRTLPDPGKPKRTQQDCGSVWPDSAGSKLDPLLFRSPLLGDNRWQPRLKKQNCFM